MKSKSLSVFVFLCFVLALTLSSCVPAFAVEDELPDDIPVYVTDDPVEAPEESDPSIVDYSEDLHTIVERLDSLVFLMASQNVDSSEPSEYQQELLTVLTSINTHLEALTVEPEPEPDASEDDESSIVQAQEQQELRETLSSIRDSLVVLSSPAAQVEESESGTQDGEQLPADVEPEDEEPEPEPVEESEPAGEGEVFPEITEQDFYRLVLAALVILCSWPLVKFFYRFLSSFFPV